MLSAPGERALAARLSQRGGGCGARPIARQVFAQWAFLLKRQERWAEAADLWQRWLTSVPGNDALPFIELAKYHEWRTGDLAEAEMWAAWGLHTVETAPASQRQPGPLADLRHRLERIRRKRRGGKGDTGTE